MKFYYKNIKCYNIFKAGIRQFILNHKAMQKSFFIISLILINAFLSNNSYAKDFFNQNQINKKNQADKKLFFNTQAKIKKIGILFDGPYWWNEKMINQIKFELNNLNLGEFDLVFPEDANFNGQYDVQKIQDYALKLANNKELSVILSLGTESTKSFTKISDLSIPVVAIGVDFPTATGILDPKTYQPINQNLTFIYDPAIETSYTNFIYDLVDFKKFTFLCSDFILKNNPIIKKITPNILKKSRRKELKELTSEVLEISPLEYEKQISDIETDVILVGRLCGFNDSNTKNLFNIINQKKIPSITTDGLYGVNRGALASLSDYDFKHMGRKYALKLYNILTGIKPSELSVIDNWKLELIFNQETARKIGYDIPLEFLYDANIVGSENPKMPLTLQKAIEIALKKNYEIIVKNYETQMSINQNKLVKGGYLPNIDSNINCLKIDNTRADLQPGSRIQTQLELSLFQNIYNPELNKSIKLSKLGIESSKINKKIKEQDIIQIVMLTYLNYMLAEDNLMVRKEQLRILRKHKDIAQLRYDLEEINKSDVLRLEIQYDQGRMDLVSAHASLNHAKAELVNLLNLPEENFFQMVDRMDFSPEAFKKRTKIFDKYYKTQNRLKIFQKYFIQMSYKNSVELKALNTSIKKAEAEKERIAAKFLPFVNFGASWFHRLHSEHRNLVKRDIENVVGIDSVSDPGNYIPVTEKIIFQDEEEIYDDSTKTGWQAILKLNYPIYSGGTRFNELDNINTEIKKLRVEKEKLKADIAKNIRILYYDHYTTRNNSNIAIRDVELARENLRLGETAYMQGGLAIIDLLNIQSSLILSEINATFIRYDYLKSIVNLFRSISMTEIFAEPENSPKMIELLKDFELFFKNSIADFF